MLLGRWVPDGVKSDSIFYHSISLAELDEGTNNKHWRIKVTHVQQESETLFKTIEEAMEYMKTIVEAS